MTSDLEQIGGEMAFSPQRFQALTLSGRFSLRLIIHSAALQGKKVLLPECLCQVIVSELTRYNISFGIYSLGDTLEPIWPENFAQYEVIYLIQYFGMDFRSSLPETMPRDLIVIIDDVFSPLPRLPVLINPCYSFNSLRKISPLADGSILVANRPLMLDILGQANDGGFSAQKYLNKGIKHEFLSETVTGDNALAMERRFLEGFSKAEQLLDYIEGVPSISLESQYLALEFMANLEQERLHRKLNYLRLQQLLPELVLPMDVDFFSFALLRLPGQRDELRQMLATERIFLPVHWPEQPGFNSDCTLWLSVPLDSRYHGGHMSRIADKITAFYQVI
ncbi:aspartate aminotransferase family protein [Shewanella cyperi]|uniref:hypothetical protein n=1 Tax=Shewanella cyperi TaxID=2814292 RepID=UPI001A94EBE3|nr:hypothetical protein [Shewanella cyperi]QSX39725.1 hypothetical protein JYB84_11940 [Shewanella cyperi]